jgi:hypothetical protein
MTPKAGRADRSSRITQRKGGTWGTSSQDLLFVAARLFHLSKGESSSALDRNFSRFVYGGIPLLLAAAHSFSIEYEGINLGPIAPELASNYLLEVMTKRYAISGVLLTDLGDLIQVRNEIIHPVALPTGTPDNWPNYLRRIKKMGLLSTTGNPIADYLLLDQIASHRLFAWAVDVVREIYTVIVNSDPKKLPAFQRYSYANFEDLFG